MTTADDLVGVRRFDSAREEKNANGRVAYAWLTLDDVEYCFASGTPVFVDQSVRGGTAPGIRVVEACPVPPSSSGRVVNVVRRRASFDFGWPHTDEVSDLDLLVGVCEETGGVLFEVGVVSRLFTDGDRAVLPLSGTLSGRTDDGDRWTFVARNQGPPIRADRILLGPPVRADRVTDAWSVHRIRVGSWDLPFDPPVALSVVDLRYLSIPVLSGQVDFWVEAVRVGSTDRVRSADRSTPPPAAVVCRAEGRQTTKVGDLLVVVYPDGRHDVWPHEEPRDRWNVHAFRRLIDKWSRIVAGSQSPSHGDGSFRSPYFRPWGTSGR